MTARKNGCFNRADYAAEIQQQDGWTKDGSRNMVPTPHRMAGDCQYTHSELGQDDKGCIGCSRMVNKKVVKQGEDNE